MNQQMYKSNITSILFKSQCRWGFTSNIRVGTFHEKLNWRKMALQRKKLETSSTHMIILKYKYYSARHKWQYRQSKHVEYFLFVMHEVAPSICALQKLYCIIKVKDTNWEQIITSNATIYQLIFSLNLYLT